MSVLLLIVVLVLACIIYAQYRFQKKRSSSLDYISKKLGSIIAENTGEKLMVITEDKELIGLLKEVNRLLDFNHTISANFSKAQISTRKMISNISHDLKTPLTVVLGYLETIRLDGGMEAGEIKTLLARAEQKAAELLELINKFFDLARLESEDRDIALTRVNMNEICRKSILSFYDILTAKGIEVNMDIPEANIYALGNEDALDRIMNNLLSNSVKYGSEGRVIGLILRFDDEAVYVDVWDKGKGIADIHKDKVFERMYTLEDSRNKNYQGSGLGLSITKRLVEKQGGEISLSSKPYEKTVFTFKLKRLTY